MQFSFPYKTKIAELKEFSLALESLESLDNTIDEFFKEYESTGREELFEDLCPYFGVLWPAGKMLARIVSSEAKSLRGKRVLEIGCGLALPSFVLSAEGAEVYASDLHPDVPVFLERNRRLNGGRGPLFLPIDWRRAPAADAEKWDLILGSDILYDRTQPEKLLAYLTEALGPEGEAWISDPGRPYLESFVKGAREKGWFVEESLIENVFMLRLHHAS